MKSQLASQKNAIALGLIVASALPFSLGAQTWTGAGENANWSNTDNWNTGVAPVSDGTTEVTLPNSTNTDTNLDYALRVRELNVTATAGAFTISGERLTISGTGQHDSGRGIRNLSTNTLTINSHLRTIGAVGILAHAGDIVINGGINLDNNTNNFRLMARAGKSITLNSSISGSAFVAYNSGGSFYINAANSYSGTTGIWDGTIYVSQNALANQDGAFGKSDGIIGLGANVAGSKVNLLTTDAVTIGRELRVSSQPTEVTIGGDSAHVSNYTRNIIIGTAGGNAAKAFSVTAAQGGRVNFSGNFRREVGATGNSDNVTKIGEGIVALSGEANDYQGKTLVEEGTLLINGVLLAGGGEVIAHDGTTLGGNGIINRDIIIESGASFSAGDIDEAGQSMAQAITINGNANFHAGSFLYFDLGSTSDTVTINGDLGLSGYLVATALTGFGNGTYTLFTYTGDLLSNDLNLFDMPEGYSYAIDTSIAGYVNLIVVPEPSVTALALGSIALIGAVIVRRRNRNKA